MNPVTYRNGSHLLPAPHPRAHSPPKSDPKLQHDLSFLAPAEGSHLVPRAEEAAGLKAAGDAAVLPKQDARVRVYARTRAHMPCNPSCRDTALAQAQQRGRIG